MTDTDPSSATGEPECPRCRATEAAAKAEIGQVAKACIGHLGRVADDVIGLLREARASEQAALYAWKAATDLSGEATTADTVTRTAWRLTFVTDTRDSPNPVAGNAGRPSRTEDGRWLYTVTAPLGESIYRILAAKAVRKGMDDVQLSKCTVFNWIPLEATEWEPA